MLSRNAAVLRLAYSSATRLQLRKVSKGDITFSISKMSTNAMSSTPALASADESTYKPRYIDVS